MDLGAEFGLDRGVTAKEEDAPAEVSALVNVAMVDAEFYLRQGCRRGLMTSDEESHHLVDKFLVREAARLQSHGDNVNTSGLLLFHGLSLFPDEIPTSLLDEALRFDDFLVPLIRDPLQNPERYKEANDLPHLATLA